MILRSHWSEPDQARPRKVGGGRTIRSIRQNDHVIISSGGRRPGMSDERMSTALTDGIGLSNVNERLSVIYGAGYRVRISSLPELGTIVRLEIPGHELCRESRRCAS
jgi:sensor histidine kinase YesM